MITELQNYDVKLILLTKDKVELVRQWRNDPKISQYMEYRTYITPEMQQNWFNKINNGKNFYFIINYNKEDIGLINIKDYDSIAKEGEAGVFIYEDKYINTDIAYRAHLVLFDYFFQNNIIEIIRSHILDENTRAIRFAQFLGSKKIFDKEYRLSKGDYLNNRNRLHFIKKWTLMQNK